MTNNWNWGAAFSPNSLSVLLLYQIYKSTHGRKYSRLKLIYVATYITLWSSNKSLHRREYTFTALILYTPKYNFMLDEVPWIKLTYQVYISPYIYSKYGKGTSTHWKHHQTPDCKPHVGMKEYIKCQMFWKAVCSCVSAAIGQHLLANPQPCLLGKAPASLKEKMLCSSLL